MKFKDLTECPFCGNKEFIVRERTIFVYDFVYSFDGNECDNSGIYDSGLSYSNDRAYCDKCGKYIGNHRTNVLGGESKKALKERESE